MRRIEALAEEPQPPGAEALAGDLRGPFRIRVGDYRVIYGVMQDPWRVLVYSVGHRSRIYKDAERQD
jgi:mRNA interferase RelE/StbE